MKPRTQQALVLLAILLFGGIAAWYESSGPAPAPSTAPRVGEEPPVERGELAPRRYRPQGPLPQQALPGGGLAAHEGERGGHTLARHVGRTLQQLRERLEREDKREVSTFTDLETAERAVARVLYERRRGVQQWLDAGARGDQAITSPAGAMVGQVLKAGAREAVPGHTVTVVLAGSDDFPEGFVIRTAYVRTP